MKVKRALISVYDKTGVVDFARGLVDLGAQIVSTGGTARLFKESGVPVTLVEEVTGFPEMLDGRVKTMHPRLMGGVLANREVPSTCPPSPSTTSSPSIWCLSLYPFEQVASRRGVEDDGRHREHRHRRPLHDQSRRQEPQRRRRGHGHGRLSAHPRGAARDGELAYETLRRLAAKAFQTTAHYDIAIANWFMESRGATRTTYAHYRKFQDVSYGENPHQRAAYYVEVGGATTCSRASSNCTARSRSTTSTTCTRHGHLREYSLPCVVMIKHNNPCGCAVGESLAAAYDKALACDPVSAFGSIISVNRTVDVETAERLSKLFVEVIFAPGYERRRWRSSRASRTSASFSTPSAGSRTPVSTTANAYSAASWCRTRTTTSKSATA